MGRTTNILKVLFLATIGLSLSGCLPATGTSEVDPNCGATSLTINPTHIDGGHHLYFNSQDLAILVDPKFELDSITLYLDVSSSHLKSNSEVTIGVNGIVATRNDGSKKFDDDNEKRGEKFVDQSKFAGLKHIDIEKLKWNGGESIVDAFIKIQKKKGEIKVSIQGADVHVTSGFLVINGVNHNLCATPTPGPSSSPTSTPTPVPTPTPLASPSVSIDSALPSESLTNQNSIIFNFSSDQAGVSFYCSVDNGTESVCSSPLAISDLSSADHTFKVYAKNSAGLSSSVASHAWTVDTVPPVVDIQPVTSPTNLISTSISFSSSTASSFKCSLDGASMSSCSSPYAVFAMTEGAHSFQVVADDAAGNLSVPARVDWIVDLTPPTVQIVSVDPVNNPSSSTTRNISFAAIESANFECSFDGASYSPCGSPNQISNLNEGSHEFQVRAVDAAGNVGPSASASWVTDLTPPQLSLGTVLPSAGSSNASTYHVDFSSNEPSSFKCKFDGADEVDCASPFDGSFQADGQHSFSVVAVDIAGLRSSEAIVSWDIDRTAPEISFGAMIPSASNVISSSSLEVEVVSAATVTLHASLNHSDIGVVTSPFSIANLSEGAYHLEVYGVDQYGNQTQTISHDFSVDQTPPIISVNGDFYNNIVTNDNTNAFFFSSSESVQYFCELDDAGYSECSDSANVSGLIDGDHTFKVYGMDSSGLQSNIVSITWTVDTIAPQTSIAASQSSRDSFTFTFSSNEAAVNYVCSIDGGPASSCSSPLSKSFTTGSHNITAFAIDLAGNRDSVGASYGFTVRPPITTTLASNSVVYTTSSSMTFSFSSNYSDATFLCSLDGAAATACSSPITYNGLVDKLHTFKVQAVDPFGVADATGASYSWTVDSKSPVILSQTNTPNSTSFTISWTLSEEATGKLEWGVGTSINKVTNETTYKTSQSITVTGLSPNTIYSVRVAGKDRAGNTYTGTTVQVKTRF